MAASSLDRQAVGEIDDPALTSTHRPFDSSTVHESPIRLMRFPSAVRHDPSVDRWFEMQSADLGKIAKRWFDVMRDLGEDVRELLHDGHPTACVGDAAFCYVNAFTAHVNVGFFLGAGLDDPARKLEGTGKRMRHVKLRPGQEPDPTALASLIENAYRDLRERLKLLEDQ